GIFLKIWRRHKRVPKTLLNLRECFFYLQPLLSILFIIQSKKNSFQNYTSENFVNGFNGNTQSGRPRANRPAPAIPDVPVYPFFRNLFISPFTTLITALKSTSILRSNDSLNNIIKYANSYLSSL
ncbi:uncharacterized protein EV154DRAFT_433685, partial [Mucor mucedo]|uniref:uncharacterized protein n=1 Tax=Mucor mucedo TaxID=29922 RepID=UPI00221F4247